MERKNESFLIFEVNQNLVEKEQEKLKRFFEHYLPADFKPKSVMDFACGIANEEPVLRELYGDDIEIISFDSSPSMVETAKSLGRKSTIQSNTYDIFKKIKDKKFDLILGRNIPINPNRKSDDDYPDPWPDFLENIKKSMLPKSYLLTTFVREDEYMKALNLLSENNFNIIIQEKDVIVIPSDKIGIVGAETKDDYVVISQLK